MIERGELRDALVRVFPADRLSPDREQSWRLLVELGGLAAPLEEDAGGLGLGRVGIAALCHELGRHLSRTPAIPALAVARALRGHPDWSARVQSGERVAAGLGGDRVAVSNVLDGRLTTVLDADAADHLLIFGDGLAALVPFDADGVRPTPLETWDESRCLFDVAIDRVAADRAVVVACGADAERLAVDFGRDVSLALAADALGGASAALDQTIAYLNLRRQFDRPLGMFQALKHRCADLAVRIASAEALMWSCAEDDATSTAELAALKAISCEVYVAVTEEAIQLHGGIGLTEEHPIHLFMKRAMLDLALGVGTDVAMEARGRELLASLGDAGITIERRRG